MSEQQHKNTRKQSEAAEATDVEETEVVPERNGKLDDDVDSILD